MKMTNSNATSSSEYLCKTKSGIRWRAKMIAVLCIAVFCSPSLMDAGDARDYAALATAGAGSTTGGSASASMSNAAWKASQRAEPKVSGS
jgi:hypothetical protein